jgi:hypothetical protein
VLFCPIAAPLVEAAKWDFDQNRIGKPNEMQVVDGCLLVCKGT